MAKKNVILSESIEFPEQKIVPVDMEKQVRGIWEDGNSHAEVMTLLDLLCDCKRDRYLTGRLKSMPDFACFYYTQYAVKTKCKARCFCLRLRYA